MGESPLWKNHKKASKKQCFVDFTNFFLKFEYILEMAVYNIFSSIRKKK